MEKWLSFILAGLVSQSSPLLAERPPKAELGYEVSAEDEDFLKNAFAKADRGHSDAIAKEEITRAALVVINQYSVILAEVGSRGTYAMLFDPKTEKAVPFPNAITLPVASSSLYKVGKKLKFNVVPWVQRRVLPRPKRVKLK